MTEPYNAAERLAGLQSEQAKERDLLQQIVAEIARLEGEKGKATTNMVARGARISEVELMMESDDG